MKTLNVQHGIVRVHHDLQERFRCKVQRCHLDRLAMVYLRQSSPHQVFDHPESTARQYALADLARAYGWPDSSILVIDEDLGRSSTSGERRTGFERIMLSVAAGRVGVVFGLEMSRLARSSKEWHDLFEVCAVFDTLLADEDGVYDPNDPNDRLVLGLKGIISEMELHLMKTRLERGRLNKAQRGELFHDVPTGYVIAADGVVQLDPDEQVQSVIRLVFDKFDELGSCYAVFHYFAREGIRMPTRAKRRGALGEVQWRRAAWQKIYAILKHPMYSGTYAYRWKLKSRGKRRATSPDGSKYLPQEQWKVRLPDHLPSYISWEHYCRNQERLRQNCSKPDTAGPSRNGATLLAGLAFCGHCHHRLSVVYSRAPSYTCTRHLHQATDDMCHGVRCHVIDAVVAEQVLLALEPASLELSLSALENVQQERDRLAKHFQQRVDKARYQAQRAERQYMAVEPENRLVARSLEQRWEESLAMQREADDDYQRFCEEKPLELSAEERERIRRLASDIPALWKASATSNRDRQEIVRCLIERVVVTIEHNSEHVDVSLHWAGGFVTRRHVVRAVGSYQQLRDVDQLLNRVVQLRREGHRSPRIAAILNEEGYSTAKRRAFTEDSVRALYRRPDIRGRFEAPDLPENQWRLQDVASKLKLNPRRLQKWVRTGWVHAVQRPFGGTWILWIDADEWVRLQKLAAATEGNRHPDATLTTPKPIKNPKDHRASR